MPERTPTDAQVEEALAQVAAAAPYVGVEHRLNEAHATLRADRDAKKAEIERLKRHNEALQKRRQSWADEATRLRAALAAKDALLVRALVLLDEAMPDPLPGMEDLGWHDRVKALRAEADRREGK